MAALPEIQDYHAHVYFDADSREPAKALREEIEARGDHSRGVMGFHVPDTNTPAKLLSASGRKAA